VVDDHRLREFDPHKTYLEGLQPLESNDVLPSDDIETRIEKQRRLAFRQDAPLWETPQYWKNFIESRKAERELQRKIAAKDKPRRKRSRANDDEDVEIISERRSTSTSPSSSTSRNSKETRGAANGGQLSTPGPTPRKPKFKTFPGLPIRVKDGEIEYEEAADDSEER